VLFILVKVRSITLKTYVVGREVHAEDKVFIKKIKQIKIKDIKNSAVLRVEKNQNQWFSRLR
jgi:hypothetical protein